ncbi:MAG: putative addiction module antidote protein [Magnetococcales bacterium]|nr:putative addiction module antidote protein [Magnetococcales bacterium]MBF0114320.1 putative addiction module antidote protein [Magnetococcales bacterium]
MTITDFDPAAYLDNKEVITEYLSQIMENGDTDELLIAIGHVARARGMTQIAQVSGMGREGLYKAFSPGAKPRFDTVMKVLRAMGIKLHAVPA